MQLTAMGTARGTSRNTPHSALTLFPMPEQVRGEKQASAQQVAGQQDGGRGEQRQRQQPAEQCAGQPAGRAAQPTPHGALDGGAQAADGSARHAGTARAASRAWSGRRHLRARQEGVRHGQAREARGRRAMIGDVVQCDMTLLLHAQRRRDGSLSVTQYPIGDFTQAKLLLH